MQYLYSYVAFGTRNLRLIGFGFVVLFASSIGQTYFIGVFGPSIQGAFELTHTSWATVYMIGTLSSALLLPWTGQKIDTVPLPLYTTLVVLGLAGAALFVALVPSVALLVVAIFLLRQTGQGLSSHIGATAMARYFPKDRGKAVALASTGFAVGETILPALMVVVIAWIGWRYAYGAAAVAAAAIVLPVLLWLLKGHHHRDAALRASQSESEAAGAGSWTRGEVLRDPRFYLLLPATLAPGFLGTALFFHHLTFADLKGWDTLWFTGSYWIYALGAITAMLAAGPVIDRLTAVRVLPGFLLPLALGLVLVWAFDSHWWAWPYLVLLGVTSGIYFPGMTALWAEVYGTKHLGAIKSLFHAVSILASALGPLTMGLMMDNGVSIEGICLVFAVYCVLASIVLAAGLKTYRPSPVTS